MQIAFFVSSLGDTELAKSTIARLIEKNLNDTIFIIPLTPTAVSHTDDFIKNNQINRVSIDKITLNADTLIQNRLSSDEQIKVSSFINENNIKYSYIGVPSLNNEIPFQIASQLDIPCTIAYEYMFRPTNHCFWNYIDKLASKEGCDFAVPLLSAKKDILEKNPNANVPVIGHLSIDRLQITNNINSISIRETMSVNTNDELVFISGTTQPIEVDNQFLDDLLSKVSTGKYPNIQLRMGVHPGIREADLYLQTLLKTCKKYSIRSNQFKIILTAQFERRLEHSIPSSPFIVDSEISGSDAAQAADKVAQAVPGALLNKAALNGKPSYFHDKSTIPYLPSTWFSDNLDDFFKAKRGHPHSKKELGIKENAPNILAKLIMSKIIK